jgi:hypothetical protein
MRSFFIINGYGGVKKWDKTKKLALSYKVNTGLAKVAVQCSADIFVLKIGTFA